MFPDRNLKTRWQQGEMNACESIASQIRQLGITDVFGEIFTACCKTVDNLPNEVRRLIEISKHREDWNKAHSAFGALRKLTIKLESDGAKEDNAEFVLLFVSENFAKLMYNTTSPDDPFDDDSESWFFLTVAQMYKSLSLEMKTIIDETMNSVFSRFEEIAANHHET
jgi:hypothetical protein